MPARLYVGASRRGTPRSRRALTLLYALGLVLVAASAAVTTLLAASTGSGASDGTPFLGEPVPDNTTSAHGAAAPPLALRELGPRARSLRLLAPRSFGRGCYGRPSTRVVERTSSFVLVEAVAQPAPDRFCNWDLGFGPVYPRYYSIDVPLARALRGERILGLTLDLRDRRAIQLTHAARTPSGRRRVALRMPRVLGLAPGEARAVLGTGRVRLGVVRWVGAGRHGTSIVGQRPAPAASVPFRKRRSHGRSTYDWSRMPITLTTAR